MQMCPTTHLKNVQRRLCKWFESKLVLVLVESGRVDPTL